MSKQTLGSRYLSSFLKIAPLSHALWRSCEALAFSKLRLKCPVLDIGCGFGEFAGVAFNMLEMGIDINEEELKKALSDRTYRQVLWADARKLPFKNGSYSTVVSVSVMEHISRAERVIDEVSRVLKKGGIFAFSVPTPLLGENLLVPLILRKIGAHRLANVYFRIHCSVFKHITLRKKGWWLQHLEKSGFKVITVEGTISPLLVKLHEIFLIFALPSQLWKLLFGKRLILSVGLRSKILPLFFSKFVDLDIDSDINIFVVAQKI